MTLTLAAFLDALESRLERHMRTGMVLSSTALRSIVICARNDTARTIPRHEHHEIVDAMFAAAPKVSP